METFRVEGGHPLRGIVAVDGSKNASLPILAACLAIRDEVQLDNVPGVHDVATMRQLLELMGARISEPRPTSLTIDCRDVCSTVAPYEHVRRMRASVCVLGPLLARFGQARVSMPGGCQIGHRPIDLHLRGLAALGAEIRLESGDVVASARGLRGAEISMVGATGPSVTGTCNVMTAAVLAKGRSVIRFAAQEPEVVDLGRFLIAAGARINGLGTSVLEIDGVEQLHGVRHQLIADRIEAATIAIAAVMTRGDVTIANAPLHDMAAVLAALDAIGADVRTDESGLRCRPGRELRPARFRAEPYPGLPTDVQAQLTALMAIVPGESQISDLVFPERFMHVAELIRLGAAVRVCGNTATVNGREQLFAAPVVACDLRASAALVLAGLVAEGVTEIRNVEHLDRGYCAFERKLRSLGAVIERTSDVAVSTPPIPSPHIALDGEPSHSELLLVEQRR